MPPGRNQARRPNSQRYFLTDNQKITNFCYFSCQLVQAFVAHLHIFLLLCPVHSPKNISRGRTSLLLPRAPSITFYLNTVYNGRRNLSFFWTVCQTQADSETSPCSASSLGSQRDTARICCSAPAPAIDRYLLPARGVLSSRPDTRRGCCQSMGQTDGRTLERFIDPAPHTTQGRERR